MGQWWSWILAAIGISGLYLAGSKRSAGWAVGIAVQVLWIAYAVVSRQWGFIFSAIGYGWVGFRNWRRWREEAATAAAPTVTAASG